MKVGRYRRVGIVVVTMVVCAIALYGLLRRKADPVQAAARAGDRAGPVNVTAVTAKKGDIGAYRDAIGTVTPVYTATITSQVSGILSAVHYREAQIQFAKGIR